MKVMVYLFIYFIINAYVLPLMLTDQNSDGMHKDDILFVSCLWSSLFIGFQGTRGKDIKFTVHAIFSICFVEKNI